MTRSVAGVACAMVLSMAGSVLAHHSAAGVDRTKTVTVAGTVKEFRWTNPHSWIDLEVPDSAGGTTTWSAEMTSPAFLLRAGWRASTVKPGDKVSIVLRPMRSGDPGGLFVSITLPDGRVMGERPPAPAAAPAPAQP